MNCVRLCKTCCCDTRMSWAFAKLVLLWSSYDLQNGFSVMPCGCLDVDMPLPGSSGLFCLLWSCFFAVAKVFWIVSVCCYDVDGWLAGDSSRLLWCLLMYVVAKIFRVVFMCFHVVAKVFIGGCQMLFELLLWSCYCKLVWNVSVCLHVVATVSAWLPGCFRWLLWCCFYTVIKIFWVVSVCCFGVDKWLPGYSWQLLPVWMVSSVSPCRFYDVDCWVVARLSILCSCLGVNSCFSGCCFLVVAMVSAVVRVVVNLLLLCSQQCLLS